MRADGGWAADVRVELKSSDIQPEIPALLIRRFRSANIKMSMGMGSMVHLQSPGICERAASTAGNPCVAPGWIKTEKRQLL